MTSLSNFEKVKEFHEVMGMSVGEWPPTFAEREFREGLISEEWSELWDELFPTDFEGDSIDLNSTKLAKELADLLYVVYGTAVSFGIDIDKVFTEVHKSNMSKLEDGKPVKREDGKVLKGKNYAPPNLEKLEFIFK